jgi:signal transduction histidine kinase
MSARFTLSASWMRALGGAGARLLAHVDFYCGWDMNGEGRAMKGPEERAGRRNGRRAAMAAGPGHGTPVPVRATRLREPSVADASESTEDGRANQAGDAAGISWVTVAKPSRAGRPWRMSLTNWPVSTRLGALFVAASVMGLLFGGLRIYDAVNAASQYARTAQLAVLGRQVTALAQALENERDVTAGYEGYQALAAADPDAFSRTETTTTAQFAQLEAAANSTSQAQSKAFAATNPLAAQVASLAGGIGSAFPTDIQQKAQNAAADASNLAFLRADVAGQSASPTTIIQDYEGTLDDLFLLDDEIASQTGDPQLSDEVRALGDLSRAKDQASQERAILYGALAESGYPTGRNLKPAIAGATALASYGGEGALTAAADAQFSDTLDFESAATPTQAQNFLSSAVTAPIESSQAIVALLTAPSTFSQAVDASLGTAGTPGGVYPQAVVNSLAATSVTAPTLWYGAMSAQVNQMRAIETQVSDAIVTRSQMLQHQAIRSAQLTAAATAGAVLLVLLVTFLIARSMVNPLRRLQADALEIAAVRLPARVAAAASGTDPDEADGQASTIIEPIGVQSTDEIGRVARAFDQVHAEAVRLAGTEAQLRGNLNSMFISLSRRSVPLIDRLARMIDSLEQSEDDPDQLANLFSMDHLVTRMRRNSENLLVLAGEEPVRKWTEPVPLADVARAAAAEIEQYARVALAVQPGILVSGQAVADIVHLLAELIENATLFSPRDTQVQVTAQELSTGGVLVEVRDEGVGVSATRLGDMNWRLDHPPGVDVSVSRHMGLFAVSRLAARNGIRVRLRAAAPQGLSALVWLPGTLTSREPGASTGLHPRMTTVTISGPPIAGGVRMPVRRTAGRHRLGLTTASGAQPALAGAGRRTRTTGAQTAWFAAKNPSGRGPSEPSGQNGSAAQSVPAAQNGSGTQNGLAAAQNGFGATQNAFAGAQQDAAAYDQATVWQGGVPVPNWRFMPAPDVPVQRGQTAAGLPRRVPQANANPGTYGTPSGGFAATPDDFGGDPADGYASLAGQRAWAPTWGAGDSDAQAFGGPTGPQQAREPRRRSPEAARSRMAGFQLGSRDAAQAGRTAGWTSSAGEEPSR